MEALIISQRQIRCSLFSVFKLHFSCEIIRQFNRLVYWMVGFIDGISKRWYWFSALLNDFCSDYVIELGVSELDLIEWTLSVISLMLGKLLRCLI